MFACISRPSPAFLRDALGQWAARSHMRNLCRLAFLFASRGLAEPPAYGRLVDPELSSNGGLGISLCGQMSRRLGLIVGAHRDRQFAPLVGPVIKGDGKRRRHRSNAKLGTLNHKPGFAP